MKRLVRGVLYKVTGDGSFYFNYYLNEHFKSGFTLVFDVTGERVVDAIS